MLQQQRKGFEVEMAIGNIDIGNTFTLATFIKMDAREIDRLKKTAFATVSKKGKVK